MSTFITRLDPSADGVRVAVKDVIDVAGVVTTAGSPAFAAGRRPATHDAACVAAAREAGAVIVGKVNLHELAFGSTGVNPWFGTPVNPRDERLVPGGSSSGSAVAVATGEADIAWGTDTGGSVRLPAACCGVVGLKTTWGRVPTDGVTALAPSLDTLGPLALTVDGVVKAMAMVEPGFAPTGSPRRVGRLRGLTAEPAVDEAVDGALAAAGLEVREVPATEWDVAGRDHATVIVAEAWRGLGHLVDATGSPPLGGDVEERLRLGSDVSAGDLESALSRGRTFRARLESLLEEVDALALPTLLHAPPTVADVTGRRVSLNRATAPVNLAGLPALSLPVPTPSMVVPASLQLIGPAGGEERLCALGLLVEAACST